MRVKFPLRKSTFVSLDDGFITVTVMATDLAGNHEPANDGTDTITADNTPPGAVTSFKATPSVSAGVKLEFSLSGT